MPENVFIIRPNCNDVLLARGFAAREHSGTKQFHRLCREYAEEYFSSNKQETKHIVAYRIINGINDLVPKGRFLVAASLAEAKELGIVERNFNGNVWQEVDAKIAVQKTKHAIRDARRAGKNSPVSKSPGSTRPPSRDGLSQNDVENDVVSDEQFRLGMFSQLENAAATDMGKQQSVKETLSTGKSVKVHSSTSTNNQNKHRAPGKDAMSSSNSNPCEEAPERNSKHVRKEEHRSEKRTLDGHDSCAGTRITTGTSQNHSEGLTPDEKEAANQLLALLTLEDKPKFTDEDALNEAGQMTDAEKIEAAKDVFGESVPVLQNVKRVKRTFQTPTSVTSLLQKMKLELAAIDVRRKAAFLDALTKADASEFSDERLKGFLLREDNNPKLAAERLVAYWTARRTAFGPDKYTSPLTLCCALRDDLVALQSKVFQILPCDSSGRTVFLQQFHYDTREGYTRESLIRANWYLFDVIVQNSVGQACEVVIVSFSGRNATLWDFDPKLGDILYDLEKRCYPVQIISVHAILTPFFRYAIKPIAFAMMEKRLRSRTVVHDINQCPESLANYGIHKHMLPREMGGTLEIDQLEWIKERIVEDQLKERRRHGRNQCTHTLEDALLLVALMRTGNKGN